MALPRRAVRGIFLMVGGGMLAWAFLCASIVDSASGVRVKGDWGTGRMVRAYGV